MKEKEKGIANVTQLAEFDEIIDVRSPAEFAEDHVPGAVNCPVLDNEERIRIGTLHKQESPFAAKKAGAALVARNIAAHLEQRFSERDRIWRPLIYCWRGGKRSGAFTHVLRQIGWDAQQLDGGYKAYRRHVIAKLEILPGRFSFRVVGGATGSGKSHLLTALATHGAQMLDLEALAAHKGSVLGDLPDEAQPSQKMFDSLLLAALQRLDPARPVFVEAESRKIGNLQIGDALLDAMRASPCLRIEATTAARVEFLLRDYAYFLADPARLLRQLDCLRGLQSAETLARWRELAERGEWPALVGELLEQHYDVLYQRSQGGNYPQFAQAPRYATDDLSPAGLERLTKAILATELANK